MGKVFITGIGAISSLGQNVTEQLESLRAGRTGIGKAVHFQSLYTQTLPFAEINLSDDELRMRFSDMDAGTTRSTFIARQAMQEAIDDAQLSEKDLSCDQTAFISSSTVGGMCYTDALYTDANRTTSPSPFVRSYEGSRHTLVLAQHFNIKGYTDTINTACSSSANAILLGARLIQTGRASRVIVGGTDCLAKYTVNGFNSLRILSELPCRPFDTDRDGLTLGEGAAYLVLESEQVAGEKRKYAEVSGFGNANDAFHPSATSDEARGPLAAMSRALQTAELLPEAIDYINAHGTGTPNNDQTESFAFSQLFESVPPFNSTKSYTGHCLAAAGSLEAVFSVLSIVHQEIYASLSVTTPIPEFDFGPVTQLVNKPIKHVLSNSFGFGGNCTSLIFSACS